MSEGLRLMAVHAHPDDESSKGAASTAMYAASGAEVMVVSCTGGERGDVLNPRLQHAPEIERDMPEVRRREMAAAARILGVQHTWLGFVDSGLPEGDPLPPLPHGCFALEPLEVTTEALVRVIRDFRPHVLTTYDENGGYPHPDHIMTHTVSMSAFEAAGDPLAYPHAGPPWQPQKLYYSGFSPQRLRKLHQAMLDAGMESPFLEWIERMSTWPERAIHTHIACSDYFEVRDEALRAHATQVDPDGHWFKIPMDLQHRVHPSEDYELARSLVPVELPEDDLFAGLAPLTELEEVCARPPERDGDGKLLLAHRSQVPPPVEQVEVEQLDGAAGDDAADDDAGREQEEQAS